MEPPVGYGLRVVPASYLECTRDDLRRQFVYLGQREDNRQFSLTFVSA
jgi:hypothetical protein